MASILDISLKAIREGIGDDGLGVTCSIYYKTKRIGEARDNGLDPGIEVDIIESSKLFFRSKIRTYNKYHRHPSLPAEQLFIRDLFILHQEEELYKRVLYKGFPILVYANSQSYDEIVNLRWNVHTPPLSRHYKWCSLEEQIKDIIEQSNVTTYRIYRTLDDFIKWK
ncbi:hypothetical protein CN918_30640 [Priestia megaterium]|nr:hypothetical protein CN918_30640 [Priestia megaterium]